jgi:sugar fermentation stimulation protein A
VVKPADLIDPAYGKQLREAAQSGVEVMAWRWQLSARGAEVECPLPMDLT